MSIMWDHAFPYPSVILLYKMDATNFSAHELHCFVHDFIVHCICSYCIDNSMLVIQLPFFHMLYSGCFTSFAKELLLLNGLRIESSVLMPGHCISQDPAD